MPLEPTEPFSVEAPDPVPPPPPAKGPTWFQKASAILFCVFCFELAIFLLVYPWTTAWDYNYFLQRKPEWRAFLLSDQFRGAVTGLGILNVFIAFGEVLRLRRFSKH